MEAMAQEKAQEDDQDDAKGEEKGKIGRFKLRANIARFERGQYKSKQVCNKVDWVFDIPPKLNWKATELQPIWQSFNTKDCKVSNLGGQRILLDFKRIGGCVFTNCFGSKSFIEKGGKIDTDEAIDLAQDCFNDKSGEMDASVREKLKSDVVTAIYEEIVSTRKLKNGVEDDSKVDEMLSSSEVKKCADGAHKHISGDNGDHVSREGDDGYFHTGVSDVERDVRDIKLVIEKVPLDTDVSHDFKIKPTVMSDASTKKPVTPSVPH
ncbi:hypothetical protein Tco_0674610 [Tanacetum coccineum]